MYTACLSGARPPPGQPDAPRTKGGLPSRGAATRAQLPASWYPPPPPPFIYLLQGRAGVGWVSSPLPPTSPPSRRSPLQGDQPLASTCWPPQHSPTRGRRAYCPLQVHPSWDPWAPMHLHSCTPRVHTIRPLHYRQRRLRRFWPWSSLRCPSSGQTSGPRTPPRQIRPAPPAAQAGHQHQDVVGMLRPFGSSAGVPLSGKRTRIVGLPVHHPERGSQLRGGDMGRVRPSVPAGNAGPEGPQLVHP